MDSGYEASPSNILHHSHLGDLAAGLFTKLYEFRQKEDGKVIDK